MEVEICHYSSAVAVSADAVSSFCWNMCNVQHKTTIIYTEAAFTEGSDVGVLVACKCPAMHHGTLVTSPKSPLLHPTVHAWYSDLWLGARLVCNLWQSGWPDWLLGNKGSKDHVQGLSNGGPLEHVPHHCPADPWVWIVLCLATQQGMEAKGDEEKDYMSSRVQSECLKVNPWELVCLEW